MSDLGTSGRVGLQTSLDYVSQGGPSASEFLIYYDADGGKRRAVFLAGSGSDSGVTDGELRISNSNIEVGYGSAGHYKGNQGTTTGGGGTNGSVFVDTKKLKYVDGSGDEREITGDIDYMITDLSNKLSLTERYDGMKVTLDTSAVQDFGQHLIGQYNIYRKTTDDGTLDGYTLVNEDAPANWLDTNVQEFYTYTYKMELVIWGTRDKYTTESNEPSKEWTNPDAPPSTIPTPDSLYLQTGSPMEGGWGNQSNYQVEIRLEYSSDASSWSLVTDSSGAPFVFEEPQGATSTDFSTSYDWSAQQGYYRFRCKFKNSNGSGDLSDYSETYYYNGSDFGRG
jgi:hypothetical protein